MTVDQQILEELRRVDPSEYRAMQDDDGPTADEIAEVVEDSDLKFKVDYIYAFVLKLEEAMEGIQQNPMARNMFAGLGINAFRSSQG